MVYGGVVLTLSQTGTASAGRERFPSAHAFRVQAAAAARLNARANSPGSAPFTQSVGLCKLLRKVAFYKRGTTLLEAKCG